MSATDNIVRDDLALNNLALNNLALSDLALGARLRVAELADVQAMHRMETALFPTRPAPTTCSNCLQKVRKITRATGALSATAEPWS